VARLARFKIHDDEAWYHVHSKVSGVKGEYLLEKPLCQRTLIDLFNHFSQAYLCDVASFCVMGNHYHLVLRFDSPRKLDHQELLQRALILYPNSKKFLKKWTKEEWERFALRLFDLSEFMRNVQAAFARWYNRTYERRGRFWADRFKSVYLGDLRAVLDCMLYVELNGVRAGLVKRTEKWKGSSCYVRDITQDQRIKTKDNKRRERISWLYPISEIMGGNNQESLIHYKSLLYYRGAVPTKEGQVSISEELIKEEERRGFKVRGMYRKQLRYFVDGVILGSEATIRQQLNQMRDAGQYLRRKNPIEQLDGLQYSEII